MPPGATHFTVQADDSSIIALTVNGEIIGVAEGTGAPVNINIPPQLPGTIVEVTVTKANYFRYEANVIVVGSYNGLIMRGHIVDDSLGGNNDGKVNPGETIDYGIWLGNVWPPDTVYSVYALLFVSDSYITLDIDSSWYGDVPADDSVLSDPFYNFSVAANCPIGHTIRFTLETHDIDDSVRYFYPSLTVYDPSEVKEDNTPSTLPVMTMIHQLYPNPCFHVVNIRYQTTEKGKVHLQIFDAAGRQVRKLVDKTQNPGIHSIDWDMKNDQGVEVSKGVYFIQLLCGEYTQPKKCVVID
jgi:hypothetical protein